MSVETSPESKRQRIEESSTKAPQTTSSIPDTLNSVEVSFIFTSSIFKAPQTTESSSFLRRLIELASTTGVDMVKWTDEEKKAYRRDFFQTCEGVLDDDFAAQFDGCNVLHHAVKAGNGLAVMFLKKFYTEHVNTDANAWQEYMLIRDAEGLSVYENAPNWFVRWLCA